MIFHLMQGGVIGPHSYLCAMTVVCNAEQS